MLQEKDARTRSDARLCALEVDVVVLQAAVDIDGSCARVTYCIGHHNVCRDGEQNLRSFTDSEDLQKSVETHPPTGEADRVPDAHRASERSFVRIDLCPLDKLCRGQ